MDASEKTATSEFSEFKEEASTSGNAASQKSEVVVGEAPRKSSNIPEGLSKNKFRKLRNHERLLQARALKRQKEREVRKEKKLKKSLGNEEKLAIAERLKNAMNTTPKVVIDCQYDKQMSYKEQTRFAQQLRRAYSSNKSCESPLHLIFTSLTSNSDFFRICSKQNDGFAKYIVDMREKNVLEVFSTEQLVYLSPDSPNILNEFDPDKVYVIGGLVDETTNKNISLTYSKDHKIASAKLPIDEYFEPESGKGTFKKVLTVNQVFDIILEWYLSKDWVKAITAGLPERTGFVPRNLSSDKKSDNNSEVH